MKERAQRLRAAQHRLARHYLDTLHDAQKVYQQGNENVAHALAMFDRERDQVKHWQAWAAERAGQDEQAAALCSDYAEASIDIFKLRLLPQEYLTWLAAALASARLLGDRRAEAVHLLGMWEMSVLVVEYHHVIDYAQQALAIAREIGDQPLLAQALRVCGDAASDRGNLEEAQSYYEQSLVLYQAIGDQRGMAKIVEMLSALALSRRDNDAAQNYLEQSLVLYRNIGNQAGLADCLNNLGYLALRRGNYSAARDYLEQSLAIQQMIGNMQGISSALSNLGSAAYYQGEYALARKYLEQGLAASHASGVRELIAIDLYKSGQVTMAQGDLIKARDYMEQSLVLSRSITVGTLFPVSLSNLAIIYLLLHQENLAYAALREGLDVAWSLPASFAHAKLLVLVAAARMWILRGEPLQAAAWLGLVENDPHPAVKMTDIKRDVQAARAECAAAISPEQFAAAWEEGKNLDLDTVVAEILSEL